MGPKIDSPRPQLLRAPERQEVAPAAAPTAQPKTLTPTPRQPADGFQQLAPTKGKTPTGGIVPTKSAPASLTIDPERLAGFKKISDNLVGFAVADALKKKEARKAFESAFILAGATKQEVNFLRRQAMQDLHAAKAGYGGLTIEKYGCKSLAGSAQAFIGKEVEDKAGVIKGLNVGQIQALAFETAKKAPDVQPDQIDLARDFFLFSASKKLNAEGFDFGQLATRPSPLDTTKVDTGEWRKKLQFLG
jgi:hypothetical protein